MLNNLQSTEYLMEGFKSIQAFEIATSDNKKQKEQYNSLLRIADHEQRLILQPLIYNDPYFQRTLDLQAGAEILPFVPVRVAAFSTACDVDDPDLRVQMEEGDLYKEADRMSFINDVAKQYHRLMQTKTLYMESQIAAIAGWNSIT